MELKETVLLIKIQITLMKINQWIVSHLVMLRTFWLAPEDHLIPTCWI
jgi:hypothetical protein